jgi:ankyrin repeat protein
MYTALHHACEADSVEIVSLLLDGGADINARSEVSHFSNDDDDDDQLIAQDCWRHGFTPRHVEERT